jgi:hypothetical protein
MPLFFYIEKKMILRYNNSVNMKGALENVDLVICSDTSLAHLASPDRFCV